MMHHSHHVQIPPSTSHHHRVNVSMNNYRNQFLDCSRTKVARPKCTVFIISLGVVSAVIYFGVKFLSGPGDLGHTSSDSKGLSPCTSLVFPITGLYCHSYLFSFTIRCKTTPAKSDIKVSLCMLCGSFGYHIYSIRISNAYLPGSILPGFIHIWF